MRQMNLSRAGEVPKGAGSRDFSVLLGLLWASLALPGPSSLHLRLFEVLPRPGTSPPFSTPLPPFPPHLSLVVPGWGPVPTCPLAHSPITHGRSSALCLVPENEAPVDTNLIELDTT